MLFSSSCTKELIGEGQKMFLHIVHNRYFSKDSKTSNTLSGTGMKGICKNPALLLLFNEKISKDSNITASVKSQLLLCWIYSLDTFALRKFESLRHNYKLRLPLWKNYHSSAGEREKDFDYLFCRLNFVIKWQELYI